ncbi:hypothetical protein SAMN05518849_1232 [Sphingobium sp. AP50]|nr:hypothetical protein SAMN05518849_1232 [Sphingobium sp. AP50]
MSLYPAFTRVLYVGEAFQRPIQALRAFLNGNEIVGFGKYFDLLRRRNSQKVN